MGEGEILGEARRSKAAAGTVIRDVEGMVDKKAGINRRKEGI